MTPDDVKKYYKSGYNFNKMTGMSANTFGNWLKWGYVPRDAQFKLETLSDGILKCEKLGYRGNIKNGRTV